MEQPQAQGARSQRQFTLRYLMLEVFWIGVALAALRIAFAVEFSMDTTTAWCVEFWLSPWILIRDSQDLAFVVFVAIGCSAGAAIGGLFHAMRKGALIGGILSCGPVALILLLVLWLACSLDRR